MISSAQATKVLATTNRYGMSGNRLHVLEHLDRQLNAKCRQSIAAFRTDAGRSKSPAHFAVTTQAGTLEDENVLHRHHLAFHPGHLADAGHLAGSVGKA